MIDETSKTKHTIQGFDGIRAIAVLIVIAGHTNLTYPMLGLSHPAIYNMLAAARGVDIFFVLSGFLITTLLVNEHARDGSISIWNFYVRRAFRILPLYYLFCVVAIALTVVGNTGLNLRGLPYLLTNFFNFVPRGYRGAIDGHIWSLSVEWHYYLVWPLVFAAIYTKRFLIAGALLVFLAVCAFAYVWMPREGAYNYMSWTIPAATPIAIGALAALLLRRHRMHWLALPIGASLYAVTAIYNFPFGTSSMIRAAGIAIWVSWIFSNQQSLLTSALEFPPLRYIGVISYGIYIWHVLLIGTGPGRFDGQTWPPDQLTGLVLLVLIAPLSYHGFELPVQSLRERFLRRKSAVDKKYRIPAPLVQNEATTLSR